MNPQAPHTAQNTAQTPPARENLQWRVSPAEWAMIAPFFHALARSPSGFLRALFTTTQRTYDPADWADFVKGDRPWPAPVAPAEVVKPSARGPRFFQFTVLLAVVATGIAGFMILKATAADKRAVASEQALKAEQDKAATANERLIATELALKAEQDKVNEVRTNFRKFQQLSNDERDRSEKTNLNAAIMAWLHGSK